MSTVQTSIHRIRAYAMQQGWRKSRLAREAGLQDTTLRHFWTDQWNPTLATLERLEAIIPADFKPTEAA